MWLTFQGWMSGVPPRAQGRSEHWQWQQWYCYLCQSEHFSEHTLLWCGELYCKTQKAATYNDVSVLRKNLGFWINIIRREMSGCAQILHAEPVMCVTVCVCHVLTCMAKSDNYFFYNTYALIYLHGCRRVHPQRLLNHHIKILELVWGIVHGLVLYQQNTHSFQYMFHDTPDHKHYTFTSLTGFSAKYSWISLASLSCASVLAASR